MVLHAGDDDFVAGPDPLAAKLLATRLMLSVALRVKMISWTLAAFKKPAPFPVRLRRRWWSVPTADGHRDGCWRNSRRNTRRWRRSPPWFLHRGGVVQIDQRLAVDPLAQNGKIGADAGKIQLRRGNRGGGKRERAFMSLFLDVAQRQTVGQELANRSRRGVS